MTGGAEAASGETAPPKTAPHGLHRLVPASGAARAALVALGLLFAGYMLAFASTLDIPLLQSLRYAGVNTAGAAVAGFVFYHLLRRWLLPRSGRLVLLLHPPLSAAFGLLWYFCILVGYSIGPAWTRDGLAVAPFGLVAFAWHLMEAVTLYAALALFVYWRVALERIDVLEKAVRARDAASAPRAERRTGPDAGDGSLLVRAEKDVVPVALGDICCIKGADGYAEVVMKNRRILSTTSLARFAEILPADRFVRVHRSHIVRLGAILTAEPAGGGKLLLRLEGGECLTTSRAGARLLKEQTV
ncbi:MAG: hypothetical protein EP335_08295 [Alphaproteobacteria bacterium]|nr:MAG: hypothetical protein EP335_08295 [Alphaproteobacteria bacterium]